MLSLNATPATATPTAYPRADAPEASREAVSARATKAVEAANAQRDMKATGPQVAAANVMDGLSTIAVAGAMGSLPAALGRMFDITLAAGSGTLTDADRSTLHAEYAQLSKQVASVVGTVNAGAQGESTADKGRDDHAKDAPSAKDAAADPTTTPDRAVRARTATPVSTVAAARTEAEHAAPHAAATISPHCAAAVAAQFQAHAAPSRSRVSLVA